MRISILLFSSMMLLLGGCAHTPSKMAPLTELSVGSRSLQKEKELNDLTFWKAEGKLMASNESEAIHASFIWEQEGPLYKIKFFGPLGISGGSLTGNTQTQRVLFYNAHGKTTYSSSPEKLIYQATGIAFPVSHLQHWIKGLPHPTYPIESAVYSKAGLLMALKQADWNISYPSYLQHEQMTHLWLPGMLKIKSKNLYLKLAIHSWVN